MGWGHAIGCVNFCINHFGCGAAYVEKRVALLISNAAYKNALPKNDAPDVSEALKRVSFETIVGLDLDEAGMNEKSIAFARAARDADQALLKIRSALGPAPLMQDPSAARLAMLTFGKPSADEISNGLPRALSFVAEVFALLARSLLIVRQAQSASLRGGLIGPADYEGRKGYQSEDKTFSTASISVPLLYRQ
jgi:hypothetical protein